MDQCTASTGCGAVHNSSPPKIQRPAYDTSFVLTARLCPDFSESPTAYEILHCWRRSTVLLYRMLIGSPTNESSIDGLMFQAIHVSDPTFRACVKQRYTAVFQEVFNDGERATILPCDPRTELSFAVAHPDPPAPLPPHPLTAAPFKSLEEEGLIPLECDESPGSETVYEEFYQDDDYPGYLLLSPRETTANHDGSWTIFLSRLPRLKEFGVRLPELLDPAKYCMALNELSVVQGIDEEAIKQYLSILELVHKMTLMWSKVTETLFAPSMEQFREGAQTYLARATTCIRMVEVLCGKTFTDVPRRHMDEITHRGPNADWRNCWLKRYNGNSVMEHPLRIMSDRYVFCGEPLLCNHNYLHVISLGFGFLVFFVSLSVST